MRDKDPIDGHERLPLFAEDTNRSLKSVPTFPDLPLQLGKARDRA
jgi:hypothetical protein